MGTFYTLGIISSLKATSTRLLKHREWVEILNERIDIQLFDLRTNDDQAEAFLRPNIFSENIAGFYSLLRSILGQQRNSNIDYYEKVYGADLENYQFADTTLYLQHYKGDQITLDVNFALLFIEGKVLVEEFDTEPILMNWLFRQSNIENKLAGCVISGIV